MSIDTNLSEESHRWYNKVHGGWLGKSIGGTLGMVYEGEKRLLNVDSYDMSISLPAANDDLDLQLVNLHALEQHGPRLRAVHLGYEWLEHVFFPFDEYGYALANLRRGLVPPVAGWFNNPFIDCMGAPIRSELWAMLAPGQPEIAVYYAWQDALVDHAGGEGMYGEIFFAAIESQAFVESDRERLIACGLGFIPQQCRVAQAVRHAQACHANGLTWQEARASVLARFGHPNFTDAPQNIAFTIIGWLYGTDFSDAVLIAINCGYDTDCTGATLGSILGIIVGADGIPARWSEPIGNQVVVSDPVRLLDAPSTLEELTERTLRVAHETQALWQNPRVASRFLTYMREELNAFPARIEFFQGNDEFFREDTLSISVAWHNQLPVIGRGQSTSLLITLTNKPNVPWQGIVALRLPAGWLEVPSIDIELAPMSTRTYSLEITADAHIQPFYEVGIDLTRSYQGVPWHTRSLSVALVPASHWEILAQGQDVREDCICAGNTLTLPAQLQDYSGILKARTLITNPSDRMVRWVIVAPFAVEVWFDGKHMLTTRPSEEALPTFHRPEDGSFCEYFVSAGTHTLELVFTHNAPVDGDGTLMIVPVSTSEIEQPGLYYYLTDLLFTPTHQ